MIDEKKEMVDELFSLLPKICDNDSPFDIFDIGYKTITIEKVEHRLYCFEISLFAAETGVCVLDGEVHQIEGAEYHDRECLYARKATEDSIIEDMINYAIKTIELTTKNQHSMLSFENIKNVESLYEKVKDAKQNKKLMLEIDLKEESLSHNMPAVLAHLESRFGEGIFKIVDYHSIEAFGLFTVVNHWSASVNTIEHILKVRLEEVMPGSHFRAAIYRKEKAKEEAINAFRRRV